MNDFEKYLAKIHRNGLYATDIAIIQANLGLHCNQECTHCHLSCSPRRTETMQWETMEHILAAADRLSDPLVDLTGGAPELNPHFRRLVTLLRENGHRVQVRTNLTVLLEPGGESLPEFLSKKQVHIVASLPCYLEENVSAQRGPGVYEKSIEAIKRLNSVGYGSDPRLALHLVYNPVGPFLPPDQATLEADYRGRLRDRFGVFFTRLLTITNMPIGRFRRRLQEKSEEQNYLRLLKESFNPATVDGLMCRHQVSVGWDGTLYDCDFNLALEMPVNHGLPNHIRYFDPAVQAKRRIVTGDHCFGCTAGAGSSCGGALARHS